MTRTLIACLLLCLAYPSSAQTARDRLQNDIAYLAAQYSKHGEFAVSVADREKIVVSIRGAQPFPLASVFKLPLLLSVLKAQEEGRFPAPQDKLTLSQSDLCIGSGQMASRGVGAQVTVDDACRLMMSVSDNTATDVLMRRLGTEALLDSLKGWGSPNAEILLTNRQAWLLSLGRVPGWGSTTPQQRVAKWEALDLEARLKLAQAIENGAQGMSLSEFQALEDRSSSLQTRAEDRMLAARLDNRMPADELARLLVRLDAGDLLPEAKRQAAFAYLAGQRFHSRLPKGVSSGSRILHKTGTLEGVYNDAGLLYTPGSSHGVAVVVLSRNVPRESSAQADRFAAEVAKLVERAYR